MGSRFSESSTLFYKEGECGFDIHAKLAELDGLLLDLQKNLPDEKIARIDAYRIEKIHHTNILTKS